jgi:hypothetical protein
MFSFLTKGLEYNKLAKNLGAIKENLDNIQVAAYASYDNSYLGPQLVQVTYMFKTEILEKMDKYNWPSNSPIFIGNLHKKTLGEMVTNTITEIYSLAQELRFEQYIKEVLTEGETYFILKQK